MKILMVCLGNICRSPIAQGVMESKIEKLKLNNIYVDSAATAGFHVGSNPDPRAVNIAKKHGIDISRQVSRQFSIDDFQKFDKIYVMDSANLSDVSALAKDKKDLDKVDLLLNTIFPGEDKSVPDPYYGGKDGFEDVYQLIDKACETIADDIASKQNPN